MRQLSTSTPDAMASFGKEILSGPLEKKAKHFPFSWQNRHFLLDERSLTYYSGAEVHTYQLRDFQDVLRKGKGEFEIVFSGTAPEVFPELRLHVRCAGGDDAARVGRRDRGRAAQPRHRRGARRRVNRRRRARRAGRLARWRLPLAPPPLAPPSPAAAAAAAARARRAGAAGAARAARAASTTQAARRRRRRAAAPAAPTTFEEMVRRQLRKKANALIVDRKEEVLALLAEIRTREFAPLPPPGARVAAVVRCAISVEQGAPIAADLKLTVAPFDGSSEVVAWWTAVAARLEAVGLPRRAKAPRRGARGSRRQEGRRRAL